MPFVINKLHVNTPTKAFLYLIKELGYTQSEAQRLIAKGRIFVEGEVMKNSHQLLEGDIEFIAFEPSTKGLQPTFISDEFVLFDKPSGVLIHPQNRHTPYSLVDELKYQFGKDANITHRIDQETSGLVLCATNKESERTLKMLFENRKIQKRYLALVHGKFPDTLHVDAPLLRKEDKSAMVRLMVKVHPEGKSSQTSFKLLEYFEDMDCSLIEATPYTGRLHQIRIHLFHVKHPIVGDPIYGQKDENIVRFLDKALSPSQREKLSGASRLLLHANELTFEFKEKKYHIQSKVDFKAEALQYCKIKSCN